MSPRSTNQPATPQSIAQLRSFYVRFGARLNEICRDRRWTAQRLADESGVSRGLVYLALRGESISLEAVFRMAGALGLKLEWDLVDPRRKTARPRQDIVHSAMGEYEARHLRHHGFRLALDDPYQHYQFAGRADLVAWDPTERALLHIENRTQFPDLQEAAGSYNSKRAYLAGAIARRCGVQSWRSETHVMVALWSAEVLHSLRLRTESFRTICPDDTTGFERWWSGNAASSGHTSTLIVLDPLATGRHRPFISLDDALTARPRHAGYADAATRLTRS